MPLLNTADALYVGSSAVDAVYMGATQVWPSGFNPLTYLSWHSAYWAEDPDWSNPGDGNAVSSWRDGSGNGRTVTQATGSRQPTYRASVAALNNRPAIDFDGTDDALNSGTFTTTTGDLTKVLVFQWQTSQGGNRHFWSAGPTGTGRADLYRASAGNYWGMYSPALGQLLAGSADQSPHIWIATFATAARMEIDGTLVASGSGGGSLSSHTLGAYAGTAEPADMYIAFAGLYNGTLTSGQKADLLAWAQDHYGVA